MTDRRRIEETNGFERERRMETHEEVLSLTYIRHFAQYERKVQNVSFF